MTCEVESLGNQRILKFRCESCKNSPSIAQTPACFRDVIINLGKHVSIDSILLEGSYVQEYSEKSISLLKEYINALEEARYLILKNLSPITCSDCSKDRKNRINGIWKKLEGEPEKGLTELKQLEKEVRAKSERGSKKCKNCRTDFLEKGIIPSLKILSKTKIMRKFGPGNGRKPPEKAFNPAARPRFLRSKIRLHPPSEAELADAYEIGETKIRIYHSPKKLEYLYFIIPPEYRLPPKQVNTLRKVKRKLLNLKGSLDPKIAREEIEKRSRELIMEKALKENSDLKPQKIRKLAKSLARFSAGFGIIEILLADPKVQDIFIDAPVGENPVHIYHQDFEECLTNVFISPENAQVLSSKLRDISGRSFSEADPTLDLNMEGVRFAAIQKPLSPEGLAIAVRRHKSTPWTLPLFVKKNFMTPKAAGLLSLIVDSQASILITGSRGSGKTSLLGSLMLELLPKYRILCLEDTAELPIEKLRSLGYKAQRLQVKPSINGSGVEVSTEDALRAALRLGESVLVMGEVRGPETKSLYEAMRIGAAGNSVMGTIHGSSTKDVYERVVYDLDIPPNSFKATDSIIVASPIRVKGSVNRIRRLTQISEVGKNWKKDPVDEGGFRNLMEYDHDESELRISPTIERGKSSLLKSISRKWSMDLSEIKENLEVRGRIQETLVEVASSSGKPELLEAENVVKSNLTFQRLLEEELENGKVNYERVYSDWRCWLRGVAR